MKPVRAVILDVYHTLLAVAPGPPDAEVRWQAWWAEYCGQAEGMTLADFDRACRAVVAADHVRMKAAGIAWPEVDWPVVARRAAPALAALADDWLDAFLLGHARLQRRTRAMPGAAAFLASLRVQGIPAGIASNAQRYTLGELEDAGLPLEQFDSSLSFWSFRHGFSKPDPAVFTWLTRQPAARGMAPAEILMIGDRFDNDIQPARAAGWQTWHFQGTWPRLVHGFPVEGGGEEPEMNPNKC